MIINSWDIVENSQEKYTRGHPYPGIKLTLINSGKKKN
jgi:hypothetical protein